MEKKPYGYWQSKTRCARVAKRCKSKSELQMKYTGAYFSALKNNWINEFFPESKTKRGKKFWTYETCKEESQKYSTAKEFSIKASRAYRVSLENGWLVEFGFKSIHHGDVAKVWTKEECQEIFDQCGTRCKFFKTKPSAYRFAQNHGWLDEICGIKNPLTKKMFRKQASQYKTSAKFRKFAPEAFKYCLTRGWINEFFPQEVKVDERSTLVKDKSIREMILDYVDANGPKTKKELYTAMLTIAGQPIDRKAWGVCWMDNVSYGTSVFLPIQKDKRYLTPVRGFDAKVVKYDIAKI